MAAALAGCGSPTPFAVPTADPPQTSPAGARFDPTAAGRINGRVKWTGGVPKLEQSFAALPTPTGYARTTVPNPFAPAVDPTSHGLANAIVSLHGLDPAVGKPWDHPPVRIELRNFGIEVRQGTLPAGMVGFVRTGDDVTFESVDPVHHMLRARGAAFFTLPFPAPFRPLTRSLNTPGVVELTSGSGYYWAAADLIVSDHPYHAVTDRDGHFSLTGVPPGQYELVCRVRNWHLARVERDPETGLVFRQSFADPVLKRTTVTVPAAGTADAAFTFSVTDFPMAR